MTVEGCLGKPRSKAINSFLIIWLGWAGSGVRDELLVWVQDIFTASLEPLADFLAISLASFAQGLEPLLAHRADHLANLAAQARIDFLQRCPTAHHEIPDGYGELAGDGSDRQVDATLGGEQLLAQRARGLLPERKIACAPSMSRLRRSLWPWPPMPPLHLESPLSSKAG